MKKQPIILGIGLLALSMAACTNQKKDDNKESSTQKTSVTAKDSSQSSSTKTSTTTKAADSGYPTNGSQNSTAETAAKKSGPDAQAAAILQQLAAAFPQQRLPQAILTSKTAPYLTAATTSTQDQANFRILYYAEQSAIGVNDQQVNQLTPIAAFEKKTYASAEQAQAAVNQIADGGGREVDLGHGITGHQQGAAGSSFLAWKEGNWQLMVRASNVEGEQAQPLAQSVVNLLETEMLPAPKNVGQITLSTNEGTDMQQNSVVWQENTVVYSIHHFDPIQSIKMATSM